MHRRKLFLSLFVGLLACLPVLANSSAVSSAANAPLSTERALHATHSIILNAFTAKAKPGAKAKLNWETGNETVVLHFFVWRATKKNGTYKKLNTAPIPAKNPGGISGETYAYTDKKLTAGKNYFYKLEVVRSDSASEWSPTVKITAKP